MRKEDNREKYKEYDHRYYIKHRRPNSKIGKLETKISDLEAKLAEKEKQLENAQNLKAIEVADELSLKLSKIPNQDKISFAIAELEKVKEKALHFYVNDTPELTSFYVDVKEIDNQIKRLTNKHEDKGE